MPAYGKPPFVKSVYPGQNALIVGFPKIEGGPAALAVDQLETLAVNYKSIPVCIAPAAGAGHGYTQRQVSWQITYGSTPSAIGWVLEGSINDIDDEYQQVDTSANIGIFTQTVASNFRFFRVRIASLTGATTAAVKVTGL